MLRRRQPSVLAAPSKPTSHVARERSTASNSFPHLHVGTLSRKFDREKFDLEQPRIVALASAL